MARRRSIKAILHNFLGTYTSRYSDHNGYWLFGLVINKFERLEFDLLTWDLKSAEPLIATAANLAAVKFAGQLRLGGFSLTAIQEARLVITKLPGSVEGQINSRKRIGHMVRFAVGVVSDYGRSYGCETSVFVAPHDPLVEWRSTRR